MQQRQVKQETVLPLVPSPCPSTIIPAALVCAIVVASFAHGATTASLEVNNDTFEVRRDGQSLQVSLKSPALVLAGKKITGRLVPRATSASFGNGNVLEASYDRMPLGGSSSLELRLFLRWSETESVLRKWATIRLSGGQADALLKEVVLDEIDAQGRPVWTHGQTGEHRPVILDSQSHPVFLHGMFVGVEFPMAATRYENGRIVLAHRPGVRLRPGVTYTTRTAVYGLTPVGREVRAFQEYIAAHRPAPRGLHINYNSWWTAPIPRYTESDILGLMKVLDQELPQRRGVSVDSVCIDMGWSEPKSIWEIDTKHFPVGLSRLEAAAQRMHSNLGLWISPSSVYPDALDCPWAAAHGFEASQPPARPSLCLGGPHYAERFRARLADLVGRYRLSHVKLDGYVAECPLSSHGHQPGACSCEAIAEGMIAAAEAARKANPKVWLESTCFGWNPSPWWLFHVNSVIGTFGDDAPAGRVPSPIYRESYTSARDFFNLQGAAWLPIPANAQEVLGIIHQSPEPFMNDAVVTVMRGHMFLPLYVNPKYMTGARWDALAGILKWGRTNAEVLDQTMPLLPQSWQNGRTPRFSDPPPMPREPYGYAHVKNNAGLVLLRNPWIACQLYRLKVGENLGFSSSAQDLSAVSLYPEPRRYAQHLRFGDTLEVPLAPYETLVLALKPDPVAADVPSASEAVRRHLKVQRCRPHVERVALADAGAASRPDWARRLGGARSAVRVALDAKIRVKAPQAKLLVLYEGQKGSPTPVGRVTINGRSAEIEIATSAGWCATGLPQHEHWNFQMAPLAAGENVVSLQQFVGSGCTQVSAWLWATKPGGSSRYPNALPQPESISLDSAALIAPTGTAN